MLCRDVGVSGGPSGTGSTRLHPRAEAALTAVRYWLSLIRSRSLARLSKAANDTCTYA